jgi:hypothetical protein
MEDIANKTYSAHQELSLLLPWYVNKALQGAELNAVENHLAVCLTCKRELIQLQKLAQAVIQEGSLDSAEQAAFSRLKKRLHTGRHLDLPSFSQQGRPEQHNIGISGNIRQLSNARKQGWMNSARPLAMAAAMLMTLSLLMPRHVEDGLQQGNSFKTLSDTQQETVSANEIRVVFAEETSQHQKNKILERIHGQFISDIPSAQGVYAVRLERGIAAKHLLDAVELLRKDASIIFAEPAYALLSSMNAEGGE